MTSLERHAEDSTSVKEKVEATVRRHGGTATHEIVDRVHRSSPATAPSDIRGAVWDLVGSKRITMDWDSKLYPSDKPKGRSFKKSAATKAG